MIYKSTPPYISSHLEVGVVQQYNQKMEPKMNGPSYLSLKSVTWYKDSHSLFDYQSNKITSNSFIYPTTHTKNISLYRKRQGCEVLTLDHKQEAQFEPEEYQLLTKFKLTQQPNSKYLINFFNDSDKKKKEINSQRLNTDQSKSANLRQEETYLIVRKQKDSNGEPKGYKLQPGQTIKLGRVEYFVSEVCIGDQVQMPSKQRQKATNKAIFKHKHQTNHSESGQKSACKICLEQTSDTDDFLFNPCKCSGSCGTVHMNCLLQWISIKVKKEVVGGTLHYNFQKFECEVCKAELPIKVQTEDGRIIQLLPIQKPKGNYLILQGACEKTKSIMMIKNVPQDGIKLGRGHQCQIRITDISVSRNHALIKFNAGAFYIFDNKSKFGTLVKEDKMELTLNHEQQQAIQIGRTVIILQVTKQLEFKEKIKTQKQIQPRNVQSKKVIERR